MRTHFVVASLAFAAALTACNRQDTPTANESRPASTVQPASDLAVAARPYQRMRFVSALEQSRSTIQPKSSEHARHATRSAHEPQALPTTRTALASLESSAPVAISVASSEMPSSTVAITTSHAAPPMTMPTEVVTDVASEHSGDVRGRTGGVMIRGGVGPNGKCDPRSDAQAAGMLSGRPNSAMPLMPSTSVFGRR